LSILLFDGILRMHRLMKIISFITEGPIISKILRHLGLWEEAARDPPMKIDTPEIVWIPIEDAGWAVPDQPDIVG